MTKLDIPSPSEILSQAAQSYYEIDDFSDWTYTIGQQADSPEENVCFYDDGADYGKKTAYNQQTQNPVIQIRVRGSTYRRAWDKSKGLVNWLIDITNLPVMVNTFPFTIQNIIVSSGPLRMGTTPDKMVEFSINLSMVLK